MIVCWEYEFDVLFRMNLEVWVFVDSLELVDCLDFCDSLMGGRINGCIFYKRVNRDAKIYYVDFTFLYFFVNKISRYSVGYFEIITRDFGDLSNYFGFVKVKISSLRGFFYFVLGYRIGGKLIFFFYRVCVER